MLSKIWKPILYFIPLLLIQVIVVPLISIRGISPNLVFVLLTYFTLLYGKSYGMILGFILGFLFDLFSGTLIGSAMLSFTISSFFVGFFYSDNKIDINLGSYFFLIILFFGAALNSIIYSSIISENSSIGFLFLILESGLLPGLYTTFFGLIVVTMSAKKGIS